MIGGSFILQKIERSESMNLDISTYQKTLNAKVTKKQLSPETMRYYLSCIKEINKKCKTFNPTEIEKAIISKCRSNQQIKKYISAIRNYEKLILKKEKSLLYGEPASRLATFYNQTSDPKKLRHNIDKLMRKINRINNTKLKYAFRLQIKSGLRVSEISDLTKQDIKFKDQVIWLRIRQGKGRKSRIVRVLDDLYMYERLQEYIKDKATNEKLFYSSAYLRKKAAEYDIPTHDFRRANARKRFNTEIQQGKSKSLARKKVQKELGHEKPATTDLYLGTNSFSNE